MTKLYETINAENWGKGQGAHGASDFDKNKRCLVERMGAAYSKDKMGWEGTEEGRALVTAVYLLYPDRCGASGASKGTYDVFPHVFNDHPDTTVEDVIRVCKVADV